MNIIYSLAFLWYIPVISGLIFQSPYPSSSQLRDIEQEQKSDKAAAANLVFKSADGGQTWQDISKGLPKPAQENNGIGSNVFFADDNGLYLTAGNELYHSNTTAAIPFWNKEFFPGEHSNISPGKARVFAFNYWGGIFQKTNGTDIWSPVFINFPEKRIRNVFETAGGTIFVGTDRGLFKSANGGITWNQVYAGSFGKMAELNGVLMATGSGILRSTDDGENWASVISEGGVGIDVATIKGGFAAISYNTASKTRRVRTSYDAGKTWQPIDAGLPADANIASVIQVGEYFFCGHPKGIYRSADKGKTWKLLLPSIGKKVFNLSVSGKVIYAIPRDGGC